MLFSKKSQKQLIKKDAWLKVTSGVSWQNKRKEAGVLAATVFIHKSSSLIVL